MRTVEVSKSLEKKLMLLGFEIMDLLAIFLVLSVLNLLFGQSRLSIPLVWAPAIGLAFVLRYGKRGKPDKYLVHWLRFQIKPGVYSAFPEASQFAYPPKYKQESNVG